MLAPCFENIITWSPSPTLPGQNRVLVALDACEEPRPIDLSIIGEIDSRDYCLYPGGSASDGVPFDDIVSSAWLKAPQHVALGTRWASQVYRLNLAMQAALPVEALGEFSPHQVAMPIDWARERVAISHQFLRKVSCQAPFVYR